MRPWKGIELRDESYVEFRAHFDDNRVLVR